MQLQYEKLLARPPSSVTHTYTERDTILYALAVGAGRPDPAAPEALRFAYEKQLQTLPMMAVVLGMGPAWITDPQWGIDYMRLLHGEQMLTVHRPLPPSGTVAVVESIEEIYDKGAGKGAVMYLRRHLRDTHGELLVELRSASFLRGNGGFGGKASGAPAPHAVPVDRKPDVAVEMGIAPDQALLYRLCGDLNPLHIDPGIAQAAGFDRPILHGLCTYGIAGRALVALFCAQDPQRVKRLDVRFSKPVYPGETLRTEAWQLDEHRAAFRCTVPARGVTVIDNGRFDFT
jgi:acyl dehydratase